MFDRNFIQVVRSGDEGTILIRKTEITAFCDNADANGLLEGSSAVYLDGGLAFAVNHSVAELIAMLKATEAVQ